MKPDRDFSIWFFVAIFIWFRDDLLAMMYFLEFFGAAQLVYEFFTYKTTAY